MHKAILSMLLFLLATANLPSAGNAKELADNPVLLFGECNTGTIQQLSTGQVTSYFSGQDLGIILNIQVTGNTLYVSSVERQQEYQMLSRIKGGALDRQWPGLMGGIGLLLLNNKHLLSGGTGRTIYPYKITSSLSLPGGQSFPAYTGKSAIKFARNSQGDIYILDVSEGALCKIKRNAEDEYDWQNMVVLSKDYPRAVQIAVDEQDRIILGIAGVEIKPLSIPHDNESRIVLLEDLGNEVRLLATKSDKSIRFMFGPLGGLVAVSGEVYFISSSGGDSIIRMAYTNDGFGDPAVILKTDKIISGLAVKNRHDSPL